MTRERNIFLALTVPDDLAPGCDDPEDIADEIVALLNRQRQMTAAAKAMLDGTFDVEMGGPRVEPIMVNGIPSSQWLTPATLERLRMLSAIDPADIRLVLSAYDYHVRRDCWGPWRARLAEAVGHG